MVSQSAPPNKQCRRKEHKKFSQPLTHTQKGRLLRQRAFEEQKVQPNVKVKYKHKAIENSLSNKKEFLMQKTEKDITKFYTRGATSPGEIERVIERSSGEVTNVIIIVFPITVDDKKNLLMFSLW